jgi:Lrp/AsnC family leucine-responsive transcriptional regulator
VSPTPDGPEHQTGGLRPGGLDDLDREIIDLLREDGRMSYTEIGRRTGLSVSAMHQRVRRLEERRIIIGYTAVLGHALLGLPYSAVIWVEDNGIPEDGQVERFRALAQIDTCYRVTGRYRYLLHAYVPGPAALERLLEEVRAAAGAPITADVVLDTAWENRARPLSPTHATRGRSAPSAGPSIKTPDVDGNATGPGLPAEARP